MRLSRTAFLSVLLLGLAVVVPAGAQEKAPPIKGLYLLTDYPSVTVRPGTNSTINLRLQNYAMPPERLTLEVTDVPKGWSARLLGGGQPVAAAMATPDQSTSLQLRVAVPADAQMGTHNLTVTATGPQTTLSLPVAVTLAKELPAQLTLEPQLPSLRGTPRSNFEFQIGVKNDSGRNLVVSLAAQAPRFFETSFTEQYGSQELSSIPVEAGQTKTVKLTVRPPSTAAAQAFPVSVRASAEDAVAETKLSLEIAGQPQLSVSGRDGRVSASAVAGGQTTVPIVVANRGTAPADEVELSGNAPSGWRVEFEPKAIDRIDPNQTREVQALITPPEKAVAGDYMATVRVSARGESASSDFRVSVATSTMWGIVGAGIIAIALLIMIGAVARFGRR